jgi:hypothetical protein
MLWFRACTSDAHPRCATNGLVDSSRFAADQVWCTIMISLPSLRLSIGRFFRRLVPDAPFLVDRDARYSGPIPHATKNWCILALVLNAAVSVIAAIALRNLAPVLIASLGSLFPAYILLFWRDLGSTLDDVASRQAESNFLLPMLSAQPSVEWAGICLAVGSSVLAIVGTVVAGFHLAR